MWHRGGVLGALRDESGKPNALVRGLALVVALCLAFPLTLLVLRLLERVLRAAY